MANTGAIGGTTMALIAPEPDGFSSGSEGSRRAEHFLVDGLNPLAAAVGVRGFGAVFRRSHPK